MKKMIFYIVSAIALVGTIQSCQKGEIMKEYTQFTNLVVENFENGYTLEVNGRKFTSERNKIETIEGESTVRLYNAENNTEFEGKFQIEPYKDTLLLFKINNEIPATLVRKDELDEPHEQGKLKFKIVNSNKNIEQLTEGKPFHLVFYQVLERLNGPPIRRKIVFHEEGDTIFNINNKLPDMYQSIDISDNMASLFKFEGRAQVLKEDYSPLMKDNMEVFVEYNQSLIDMENKSTYILFLQNEDGIESSFFPNIPSYWQFPYTLMSAYSN